MSSNRQGFVQTSFAYLVCFLLPLNLSAALYQIDQVSQPSGFVSQSEAIEGGTSKNSVTPDLLTNGYAFGYWEINGVRQAGDDNRSLVQVSTTISANTTFKAFYFSESADSDNDGIKDWYEYRMFGDLSGGPLIIRTGMDIPTRRRASSGRTHWWWTKCSGGVYPAGCRTVLFMPILPWCWPRSRAIQPGLSPSRAIMWRATLR